MFFRCTTDNLQVGILFPSFQPIAQPPPQPILISTHRALSSGGFTHLRVDQSIRPNHARLLASGSTAMPSTFFPQCNLSPVVASRMLHEHFAPSPRYVVQYRPPQGAMEYAMDAYPRQPPPSTSSREIYQIREAEEERAETSFTHDIRHPIWDTPEELKTSCSKFMMLE